MLIKVLSTRVYKRKYTKVNQKLLGIVLASRDFKQNSAGNYKANTSKYTGDDKYFKYFKKAYKKQWKTLD